MQSRLSCVNNFFESAKDETSTDKQRIFRDFIVGDLVSLKLQTHIQNSVIVLANRKLSTSTKDPTECWLTLARLLINWNYRTPAALIQ
jgi:hypothetical protein